MKKIIWVFPFLLVGCASMVEAWRAQECNAQAALEQGMNDAREGMRMSSAYLGQCGEMNLTQLKESYSKGYLAGSSTRKEEGIHIHIGSSSSASRYQCVAKGFIRTFTGEAASENEARVKAMTNCRQEDGIHCKITSCGTVN